MPRIIDPRAAARRLLSLIVKKHGGNGIGLLLHRNQDRHADDPNSCWMREVDVQLPRNVFAAGGDAPARPFGKPPAHTHRTP